MGRLGVGELLTILVPLACCAGVVVLAVAAVVVALLTRKGK